jgi:hypothetical protein
MEAPVTLWRASGDARGGGLDCTFEQIGESLFELRLRSGGRLLLCEAFEDADLALLDAISRGEFAPAGFRNRDIRRLIHRSSANPTPRDRRRLSAKTSRQL